jgi:hypothetical protein
MVKFSINQTTTMRWAFDEDLVHYHQAGIGAVHAGALDAGAGSSGGLGVTDPVSGEAVVERRA